MSTVTVVTAQVDVDGIVITLQRTGPDWYLLTFEGNFPHTVKGYDAAVAACDQFAVEIAKLVPAREQVKIASEDLDVYAKAKADEFENTKLADPLELPANTIKL